jgi:DNA-binding response OmpR family regulator
MPRILLIDDDDQLRQVLEKVLVRAGYEVVSAGNGREAGKVLDGFTPDLVITDLVMPEQEGLETIRSLRKTNPGLPIMAISGSVGPGSGDFLKVARLLGVNATLAKPFEPKELVAKVSEVLSGS